MLFFFFFNDTATTEIYTLSLHDALPISTAPPSRTASRRGPRTDRRWPSRALATARPAEACTRRSEEHTSELQSRQYLVCRLLLEKKKKPPSLHSSPLLKHTLLQPRHTHL